MLRRANPGTLSVTSGDRNELWHPASATALERALHPAGHGPNNVSLFQPQAAVVVVAPKGRAIGMSVMALLTA
mgnify:CR=1 FL=1